MSYSYDRYERTPRRPQPSASRRGTFSYWLPLAFTVTVATVGIAAWIWSERNDDEDELPRPPGGPYGNNVYTNPQFGPNPDNITRSGPPSYADVRPGEVAYGTVPGPQMRPEESQSYMARMSGALRRTPSPQQVFDGASRTVVSGIAAASAVVGTALSSIREEDKNAYKDHKTWSEEAEARRSGVSPGALSTEIEMRSESVPGGAAAQKLPLGSGKRRTVALVVSADTNGTEFDDDDGEFHEHAVSWFVFALNREYSDMSTSLSSPIFLETPTFRRSDCSSSYMRLD